MWYGMSLFDGETLANVLTLLYLDLGFQGSNKVVD